jgi:hypothetical protein
LLIGIRDDKTFLGLEADFGIIGKPNTDAFELRFTEIIARYLGGENRPCVLLRFAERKGKQLAVVIIPKKASDPVFLVVDGEPSFNVRSGNSSRQLNVKEATEYIRQHWVKAK